MTEPEIFTLMEALKNLLVQETDYLKQYNLKEALGLLERKNFLYLNYQGIRQSLEKGRRFSSHFYKIFPHANGLLKQAAEDNLKALESFRTISTRLLNRIVEQVNQRNRPETLYSAKARKRNLDQYRPPSVAFQEDL